MAARTKSPANDKVTVIIPKPYNIVGDTETMVGINGKMYQIEYDKPVEVPRNVAEVIEQSKEMQAKILEMTEASKMVPGKRAIAEL